MTYDTDHALRIMDAAERIFEDVWTDHPGILCMGVLGVTIIATPDWDEPNTIPIEATNSNGEPIEIKDVVPTEIDAIWSGDAERDARYWYEQVSAVAKRIVEGGP